MADVFDEIKSKQDVFDEVEAAPSEALKLMMSEGRQPGQMPLQSEEQARLPWNKPDQPGVYPLGEDPTQGFIKNVLEGLGDPTQIIANMAGGYSQAGAKGAVDWALGGAPSLVKGVKGGIRGLIEGLSAKTREAAIPVERTVPAAMRAAEIVPPGTVAQAAKPGTIIRTSAEEKAEALARSGTVLKDAYEVPPLSWKEARMTEGERRAREIAAGKGMSKVTPTPLPTKPSYPELDKEAMSILKSEEGAISLEPLKGTATKTAEYYRSAQDWFGSPYHILNMRDPSGVGLKLWRATDEADRAKKMFIFNLRKERLSAIKLRPDTAASDRVGELLDQYQTWEEVPAFIQTRISPEERQAFQWYRNKWDELHGGLVAKGLIAPERKIKSYLFRVFDKETVRKAWGDELDLLMGQEAVKGLDSVTTVKLKDQISKLRKSIDTYDRTGQVLYDYLPKELTAPFLKPREGGTGYSLDAVRAFDTYEYWYARKLFDEPAVKQGTELWKSLPPDLKPYAKWYLRQFAGMERPTRLNNLARTFTSLEYMKDLGFNVRSAIVNSTQNLNTIVDIGPKATAEGAWRAMFDKEAQAIWKASGHALDVPELRYGLRSKHLGGAMDAAGYLFDKAELANRKIAYLGGYYKAVAEGNSPEMARGFADDIVRRTQFIYGRTGAPKAMTALPGGPALMQFSTFSIKELELFSTWARENPVKLMSYLIIASGAGEGIKELGIDMSNALGIGVDYRQLFQAAMHLGKGELTATRIHAELGLPRIPGITAGVAGSGIFPTGVVPLVESFRNVYKQEWDKLLPAQVGRVVQSYSALKEGEMKTWGGAQGYPIRDISTGELRHVETPAQLTSRTFFAKPVVETQSFQASAEKMLSENIRTTLKQKAILSYMRGNKDVSDTIVKKHGIVLTPEDINNAFLRRNLTSQERLNLEELSSKQGIMFREAIGEQLPRNMP